MPIYERRVFDERLKNKVYEFINALSSDGNIVASMYSLLGFDSSTFSISIPNPGSGFGSFPSAGGARPNASPFPGWTRWTRFSRVVKLGMLWTFPVKDGSSSASLHLAAAPDLLWRYVDLYNYQDYNPEALVVDFYNYQTLIGDSTLRLLNNITYSRTLSALNDMHPITLTVTTPILVNPAPSASDLLNMKLAWLNMSDNTWIVLCNTTVVSQQCSADNQPELTATVQINASLFFDYTRQKLQDFKAGTHWSDPLLTTPGVSNFRTLGFDSNFSNLGLTTENMQQQDCLACDTKLQAAGGPCNGCGGRFELFTYAGCYAVPSASAGAMTHPVQWTVRSSFSVSGGLSGRMVSGCDTRVIPNDVPNQDTASCDGSPVGFLSKVVLQPGLGFRAIIDAGTFGITVGVGMCVTPYNPTMDTTGKAYVPDYVNSIQVSQTPLCSDIVRFYFDAKPTKPIMVVVPIMLKYIQMPYVRAPPSTSPSNAKNGMAVAWYSVRENKYYPMCTNFPVIDNSIWVNFPTSTLTNPDFTNGPVGCPDIFSSLASTRQKRCDGFGARVTCLIDAVCDGYSPECTTEGTCLMAGTTKAVQTTNGSVVVSGDLPPLVAIWEDRFLDVQSDTWVPEITNYWDPEVLLENNLTAKLAAPMLGLVVRVLFSATPQQSVTVAVNIGQRLSVHQTRVVKLAWYNRSLDGLAWTPLCNSSATTDGIVTVTIDPSLLASPDFSNASSGLTCDTSAGGLVTPDSPGVPTVAGACHFAALLVAVTTPWSFCNTHPEINATSVYGTTPPPGAFNCSKGTYRISGPPSEEASVGVPSTGCTAGHTGPDCMPCAAGKYKDVPGTSACTSCLPDTYSATVGASCNLTCIACPPFSSTQGADSQTHCSCDAGYRPAVGQLTGASLDLSTNHAGSLATWTGANSLNYTLCAPCAQGTFKSAAGQGACVVCPAGKYQPSLNSTACLDCQANSLSLAGSISADQCVCAAGYSSSALTMSAQVLHTAQCSPCSAGTYKSVNGSARCLYCDVGKYSTGLGQTTQDVCQPCQAVSVPPLRRSPAALCRPNRCVRRMCRERRRRRKPASRSRIVSACAGTATRLAREAAAQNASPAPTRPASARAHACTATYIPTTPTTAVTLSGRACHARVAAWQVRPARGPSRIAFASRGTALTATANHAPPGSTRPTSTGIASTARQTHSPARRRPPPAILACPALPTLPQMVPGMTSPPTATATSAFMASLAQAAVNASRVPTPTPWDPSHALCEIPRTCHFRFK